MSFPVESVYRDQDGTEGDFLLPEAYAIHNDDKNAGNLLTAETTIASAAPISQFDYDTGIQKEQQELMNARTVQDAIAFPQHDTSNDPVRDRQRLIMAQRRGLAEAEKEKEDIMRNNVKVYGIHYNTRAEIKEGNMNGLYKNFLEEKGLTQTSTTAPVEKPPPVQQRKQPEFYEGTYGQNGYQISEYKPYDYNTSDYTYQVSEYKSVYDK